MSERGRCRAGGWWRCASDPIRVLLLLTGAGIVAIPLTLVLAGLLPKPPPVKAVDPLKAMMKALEGIEESLSDARNHSITVKLEEGQWKKIEAEIRNPNGGLTDRGDAVEKILNDPGAIATGVKDIAAGVKDIAAGVEKVSDKTGAIAAGVKDIAAGVEKVSGKADGMKDMIRPWACESPKCLGAVHFPHDWPPEPVSASDGCGKQEWKESGSEEPMCAELCGIITKLEEYITKFEEQKSPPPVWIVGHASTLGTAFHNDGLSMRRAQFVECRLREALEDLDSRTCSTGERGSAGSLRHPDSWYRVVHVFTEKPPWYEVMECKERTATGDGRMPRQRSHVSSPSPDLPLKGRGDRFGTGREGGPVSGQAPGCCRRAR